MGNRLSKIYTRTGDQGQTGLGDNTRVFKDNIRIEAYGTVDELNSVLGLVLTNENLSESVRTVLHDCQHHLFDIGGELCLPSYQAITAQHINNLERILDKLNQDLPVLKEFILPGGSLGAAHCHLARTVCRRAERHVVTLANQEPINTHSLAYLNRLSDLLFVLARVLCRDEKGQEVYWRHERAKKYTQRE